PLAAVQRVGDRRLVGGVVGRSAVPGCVGEGDAVTAELRGQRLDAIVEALARPREVQALVGDLPEKVRLGKLALDAELDAGILQLAGIETAVRRVDRKSVV